MKVKKIPFVLIGCLLFGFVLLACPNEDDDGGNNLIKIMTVTQIGGTVNGNTASASSTGIAISFSAEVSNLLETEVVISGAAEINGAPQGGGTGWLIPVTVNAYGTAQVTVHRKGVDDTPVSVVVLKNGETRPNAWTVQANGKSGVSSTLLTFTFEDSVTLLKENINITNIDGNAIKENLDGFNKNWLLAISVIAEGDISIEIDQSGINPFPQIVKVFFYEPPKEDLIPVRQPSIDPSNPYTNPPKNVVPGPIERTPVVHEVWMGIDTNTDPRCPIGYKLVDSDKQFFDNVVIFHADLQWDHLSADLYVKGHMNDQKLLGGQDPNERGFCPKTSPHLHEPPRLQWLLANYDEYLQPIKDAGMRLLICPLPAGQGYSYGHIGAWPGINAPTGTGGGWDTVMGEEGAVRFTEALVDWCLKWGFDGIVLDDEYGDAGRDVPHRNTGYGAYGTAAYANIARWLKYYKDISAAKGYNDPITGKPGMWISVFNYRFSLLNNVTISAAQAGYHPAITAGTYSTNDIVDIAYPSQYGPTYTSLPFGLRANQWGHVFAFDGYSVVTTKPGDVKAMATTMLQSGYGCAMYFALRERSFYAGRDYFMGGTGSQPEYWLTEMSRVLYRDDVYYDGQDFPKFPVSYGTNFEDVKYTGALYRDVEPGKTTPMKTWP